MTYLINCLISVAVAVYALWLATCKNRKTVRQFERERQISMLLRETCGELYKLCNHADPATTRYSYAKSQGSCIVYKAQDKRYCVIKTFTDPDQDFNQREAEELVDHLNEK